MSAFTAVGEARLEVRRCVRAVTGGSPRAFWIRRLDDAASKWEAAARIFREQIDALTECTEVLCDIGLTPEGLCPSCGRVRATQPGAK